MASFLTQEKSRFDSRVRTAKEFYQREYKNLTRYHGGMPIGFMSAISEFESGGKMSSTGDASIGEAGYLQMTTEVARRFCMDPSIRLTPEGNIFLAGLEYNTDAARLILDFPQYIIPGSQDNWIVARLTNAIGYSGTSKLIRAANPSYGRVYEGILSFVRKTGAMPLGGQSAEKVVIRVEAVGLVFLVGERVLPAAVDAGHPRAIPSLPGFHHCLPKSVEGILKTGTIAEPIVGIGTILASILWDKIG